MKGVKKSPAELAQIAMMLEVCAKTKPGNVDRFHDYDDTWLEHFLASAIYAKPAFEKACKFNLNDPGDCGLGRLIYDAVSLTNTHSGGNTHFGAFILLIPLLAGGGIEGAKKAIMTTTVEDAVLFYRAFGLTSVRMNESDDEIDVNSPSALDQLCEKKMNLYDVMEYSSRCDMVSKEWVSGFKLTRKTADFILSSGRGRDVIPDAYISLLSSSEDTFVEKKFDSKVSLWTTETAKKVLLKQIPAEAFDRLCLEKGINPGSTADIIIAGIFVALTEGWEWDF
ncbi:triphosphoribosyl-dephospho-CoA synthase [Methanomicrobium sp. W14]|uniref:triphosphoribosyl-dephospho-CoA synthase n=1 Tax=Methanomicrobium sp. W14 TaxID=2817839 RepID=UPI001AE34049|nr:triphosphoribosyl-dephospho-CoA synthase [Methanomicrobium sp. W14]MBP2132226.1 triphosphoribosyl-dephospho-CoA synthase [Methanomicrobium sp. W14]